MRKFTSGMRCVSEESYGNYASVCKIWIFTSDLSELPKINPKGNVLLPFVPTLLNHLAWSESFHHRSMMKTQIC